MHPRLQIFMNRISPLISRIIADLHPRAVASTLHTFLVDACEI